MKATPWLRTEKAFESPIVVVGSGGSGTRVVAEILRKAGVFPGVSLNGQLDSLPFHSWINHVLSKLKVGTLDRKVARDLVDSALERHLSKEVREALEAGHNVRWMIKNPKMMSLISIIYPIFSDMTLVHVVRDGRDMAYTENYNPVAMLGPENPEDPAEIQLSKLWNYWNLYTHRKQADLGIKGGVIRFEDLIERKEETVSALCEMVGVDKPPLEVLDIRRPETIGRWRGEKNADAVADVCREGLEEFGYVQDEGG